jgi:LacI family transcriptional regulator
VTTSQPPTDKRPRRPEDREATILDVAREASVSKTTASRVLNGSPNVAPATKARVLDAVARLDYRVNTAARSLRTTRSLLVGLLVPAISNDVFGRIAEVLEQELRRDGVGVVIVSSGWDPEGERLALEALVARRVDALVVSLVDERNPLLGDLLASFKRPIVLLDREVPGVAADVVLTDQRAGIREALEHLSSLGHRSVGIATISTDVRPGREAAGAYEAYATRLGLVSVAEVVVPYDRIDRRSGWNLADAMLAGGATAVLCCVPNSVTAGVLEHLDHHGLSVPGDVSLIAFDESELASVKQPRLTVISRPIDRLARHASRMVESRLADPGLPPRSEVVRMTLEVRGSTAPPRVPARLAR